MRLTRRVAEAETETVLLQAKGRRRLLAIATSEHGEPEMSSFHFQPSVALNTLVKTPSNSPKHEVITMPCFKPQILCDNLLW